MKIMILIKEEITAFDAIILYFNCVKHPYQANVNYIIYYSSKLYTNVLQQRQKKMA